MSKDDKEATIGQKWKEMYSKNVTVVTHAVDVIVAHVKKLIDQKPAVMPRETYLDVLDIITDNSDEFLEDDGYDHIQANADFERVVKKCKETHKLNVRLDLESANGPSRGPVRVIVSFL